MYKCQKKERHLKNEVMYRNMSNDNEPLPPPIKNDKSKLSKIEDGKSSIANK